MTRLALPNGTREGPFSMGKEPINGGTASSVSVEARSDDRGGKRPCAPPVHAPKGARRDLLDPASRMRDASRSPVPPQDQHPPPQPGKADSGHFQSLQREQRCLRAMPGGLTAGDEDGARSEEHNRQQAAAREAKAPLTHRGRPQSAGQSDRLGWPPGAVRTMSQSGRGCPKREPLAPQWRRRGAIDAGSDRARAAR